MTVVKASFPIDQFRRSQNAPVPYLTMLHAEQKCAHFCSEWSIVGYGAGAFWDLWIRSISLSGYIYLSPARNDDLTLWFPTAASYDGKLFSVVFDNGLWWFLMLIYWHLSLPYSIKLVNIGSGNGLSPVPHKTLNRPDQCWLYCWLDH